MGMGNVDPIIRRHVEREILAARAKQLDAADEATKIIATGMVNRALERWAVINERSKTLTRPGVGTI